MHYALICVGLGTNQVAGIIFRTTSILTLRSLAILIPYSLKPHSFPSNLEADDTRSAGILTMSLIQGLWREPSC